MEKPKAERRGLLRRLFGILPEETANLEGETEAFDTEPKLDAKSDTEVKPEHKLEPEHKSEPEHGSETEEMQETMRCVEAEELEGPDSGPQSLTEATLPFSYSATHTVPSAELVQANGTLPEIMDIAPLENEQVLWLLQQGRELTEKGEFTKAEKLLEIASALDHHPAVFLALGRFEHSRNNLEKAMGYCLKSLEEHPEYPEGLDLLENLTRSGAVLDIKRVSALRPRTARTNLGLARICLAQDFCAEALNLFNQALAFGLCKDEIQMDLGQLYQKMGDMDQAVTHYERAVEINPDGESVLSLFDLYLNLNSLSLADGLAAKYLQGCEDPLLQARLAKLNLLLGIGLQQSGQLEQALDRFFAALESGNQDAKAWVVETVRLFAGSGQSGDSSKKQQYLEIALKLGGFNQEVAATLAESYLNTESYDKALHVLQNLHSLDPDDQWVTGTLAQTLLATGNMEQAVQLFESLAQKGPVDKNVREHLFTYYRSQGRFEDAQRQLEHLYEPDSEEFEGMRKSLLWEQVRLMTEQGEIDGAWQICQREIGHKPTADLLAVAMRILLEKVDLLIEDNNLTEAVAMIELGRDLGLNALELGLKEASIYESMDDDQAALEIYLGLGSQAPEVWEKIKELYLKVATRDYLAGNLVQARKMLEEAHQKFPRNEEVRRALGVLYQETNKFALSAMLGWDFSQETEIQVSTDHLNVLRPQKYRRIRLG